MKIKSAAKVVSLAVVALALVLVANLAWAINPNPGVLPPNSKPHGLTYGEWGAAWWQWGLLATISENPILDTTGEFAHLNQSGPVFFLAGSFGGTVVRTVTIPPGKALFFPIVNWVQTYPEDVPAGLGEEEAEAWMRENLNSVFNGIESKDLVCMVDGVLIQAPRMYRAQSPVFSMYFPPNCASVTDWGYAAGEHYPNVSDGYWVMLAPLPAGKHTIQIKWPADGSYLNITYHLTVEGGK